MTRRAALFVIFLFLFSLQQKVEGTCTSMAASGRVFVSSVYKTERDGDAFAQPWRVMEDAQEDDIEKEEDIEEVLCPVVLFRPSPMAGARGASKLKG